MIPSSILAGNDPASASPSPVDGGYASPSGPSGSGAGGASSDSPVSRFASVMAQVAGSPAAGTAGERANGSPPVNGTGAAGNPNSNSAATDGPAPQNAATAASSSGSASAGDGANNNGSSGNASNAAAAKSATGAATSSGTSSSPSRSQSGTQTGDSGSGPGASAGALKNEQAAARKAADARSATDPVQQALAAAMQFAYPLSSSRTPGASPSGSNGSAAAAGSASAAAGISSVQAAGAASASSAALPADSQAALVRAGVNHNIDAQGGGLLATAGHPGSAAAGSGAIGASATSATAGTNPGTNDTALAAGATVHTALDASVAGAAHGAPHGAVGSVPGSGLDTGAGGAIAGAKGTDSLSPLASLTSALPPGLSGAAGPAGPAGTAQVATAVGTPGFVQDFSSRIVMLAQSGTHTAQLSLQPMDLGPVSVSIQMNGQTATLALAAHHEATRAAMQEALPRLQEMFQQSGLQLADAQIGNGSARNPFQQPGSDSGGRFRGASPSPLPASVPAASAPADGIRASTHGVRLVDTFA